MNVFNYFEIAARTAVSKDDRRSFLLGAVGIRHDGTMVKALNSPTDQPNRQIHAEYRLSRKLDKGSTIYVARVRMDSGDFGMAKPCVDCMKALTHKHVKRIYYTIAPGEFGLIKLNS